MCVWPQRPPLLFSPLWTLPSVNGNCWLSISHDLHKAKVQWTCWVQGQSVAHQHLSDSAVWTGQSVSPSHALCDSTVRHSLSTMTDSWGQWSKISKFVTAELTWRVWKEGLMWHLVPLYSQNCCCLLNTPGRLQISKSCSPNLLRIQVRSKMHKYENQNK